MTVKRITKEEAFDAFMRVIGRYYAEAEAEKEGQPRVSPAEDPDVKLTALPYRSVLDPFVAGIDEELGELSSGARKKFGHNITEIVLKRLVEHMEKNNIVFAVEPPAVATETPVADK